MNPRDSAALLLSADIKARSWTKRYDALNEIGELLAETGRVPSAVVAAMGDRSPLVRIAAVEASATIQDRRVLPRLRKLLNDPSGLVRAHAAVAISSFGIVADKVRLERAMGRERSVRVKVGYAEALTMLGKDGAIETIIGALRSRSYRVRCAAANVLARVRMPPRYRRAVRGALETALASEDTVAARSSLSTALRRFRRRGAPVTR